MTQETKREKVHQQIFFFSILGFIVSLPFSMLFNNISITLMILNWLIEGKWQYKFQQFLGTIGSVQTQGCLHHIYWYYHCGHDHHWHFRSAQLLRTQSKYPIFILSNAEQNDQFTCRIFFFLRCFISLFHS